MAKQPTSAGAAFRRAAAAQGVGKAGTALSAPKAKPNPGISGVAKAGTALTAPSGPNHQPAANAVTTPSGSAATTTSAPPVAPFLTPDQQKALSDWNTNFGGDIISLAHSDTQAWSDYDTTTVNNQHTHDVDQEQDNANAAARGVFQSSIRDNALNDLAATLVQQNNIAQTNRDTALFNDQIQRGILTGENTNNENYYNALSVTNAQGVPPDTNTTTAAGTSPTPSASQAAANGTTSHPGPQSQAIESGAQSRAQTDTSRATTLSNPKPTAGAGSALAQSGNALMPPGMTRAGIMSASGLRAAGSGLRRPGAPR